MECEKCEDSRYFYIDVFEGVKVKLECECNININNSYYLLKEKESKTLIETNKAIDIDYYWNNIKE